MGRHRGDQEVEALDLVGLAGFGQELQGRRHVLRLVGPIARQLHDLLGRQREPVAVGDPARVVDRLLGLERFDEVLPADGQVDRPADARIVQRLLRAVHEDRVAAEVVELLAADQVLSLLALLEGLDRHVPGHVGLAGQDRGAPVGPGRDVEQLEAVQVRELPIPVARVADEDPLLRLLVLLEHEGARAGGDHLPEVPLVLVERLPRVDDRARLGEELEEVDPGLLESDPERPRVGRADLGDDVEELAVLADDALGRANDPLERGQHVGRAERAAVVEADPLA